MYVRTYLYTYVSVNAVATVSVFSDTTYAAAMCYTQCMYIAMYVARTKCCASTHPTSSCVTEGSKTLSNSNLFSFPCKVGQETVASSRKETTCLSLSSGRQRQNTRMFPFSSSNYRQFHTCTYIEVMILRVCDGSDIIAHHTDGCMHIHMSINAYVVAHGTPDSAC